MGDGYRGFTLAEVLITLGIIGVVAALTLPTLIQNYKKREVETKLAKFCSVMNQALNRAEVEYGDKSNWFSIEGGFEEGFDEENPDLTKSKRLTWFNKYIKPYINISETKIDSHGDVYLYFPDGSVTKFNEHSWLYFTDSKSVKTVNYQNDGGRFLFVFYLTRKGLQAFRLGLSDNILLNDPVFGCREDSSNPQHPSCAALIQQNGWKIPDDYPFKF